MFMTEQHNLMTELTRNVNNLVTHIEQLEHRSPPHRADDEDADDFGDEDADADGYARRRLNFNRRGMRGNIQGNNDTFAKIKFSLPPFAGNVDPEAYLDWELAVQQKLILIMFLLSIELDLLLMSLLILLCFGGVIFAMLIMLLLCLKLGML
jgi:hypothetical protein